MTMFLQFITATCRKRFCRYEAALTQFWSWPSYLYGIGFSQVPSSKLPIDDDVFAIHYRRVSKTVLSIRTFTYRILVLVVVFLWYSVLAGTTKQVTRQCQYYCNSSPQRVENGVVDSKLCLHNSGLGRRVSTV